MKPPSLVSPTSTLAAWEVTVVGRPEWGERVNAYTAGQAKARYYADLTDAWPDIPFTALRCRKAGHPHSSDAFIRNAVYRGQPTLRCGQRVRVGAAVGVVVGVVVGHNDSANFDVLFDADSAKYAGLTLNCHPSEIAFLT